MNLTNQIGTMVISQAESYVIGASERQNEEFRKKQQASIYVDREWLQAKMENYVCGSRFYKTEIGSGQYNDICTVVGMPGNCLADNYGTTVQKEIKSVIKSYCNGEISDEDIKEAFRDICKDMRVYHAQCRHTSGMNESDNMQIIGDIYAAFQKSNVGCMVEKCVKSGEDIAEDYGGSDRRDWICYDSEYYYQSQHLREIFQEAATEIAGEWDIASIDFLQVESASRLKLNGGLDFNSVWTWWAEQLKLDAVVEEQWHPERNFLLFYQVNQNRIHSGSNMSENWLGICVLKYGDDTWHFNVPFHQIPGFGKLGVHINIRELFEQQVMRT